METIIEQDPEECIHGMYPPEKCTICLHPPRGDFKLTFKEKDPFNDGNAGFDINDYGDR